MGQLPKTKRFRLQLLKWSEGNLRSFPWRGANRSPYEVLVAEVLLARTAAEQVEPVYRELLDQYPTHDALAEAETDELLSIVQPLGLQSMRAEALYKIGQELDEYGGVPKSREKLLDIPYIGPYAANATLCFGFGQPVPIVDANVARIYSRLFGERPADQDNPDLWDIAEKTLPPAYSSRFNLALLDFGAELCTPRQPNCESCFASKYCEYSQTETEATRAN